MTFTPFLRRSLSEMNMLRSQLDAQVVAQRATDATLHEVNQGRRLLSNVRLTKEQESEIRSQELDIENFVLLSAEPNATTGERFNYFDASAPQESLGFGIPRFAHKSCGRPNYMLAPVVILQSRSSGLKRTGWADR
eukprot:SAG11_NODE_4240_length_1992_cov_1.222927_3_plen_136_part_00